MGLAVWTEDEAGPFQTVPHAGESWQPEGHPARQPERIALSPFYQSREIILTCGCTSITMPEVLLLNNHK